MRDRSYDSLHHEQTLSHGVTPRSVFNNKTVVYTIILIYSNSHMFEPISRYVASLNGHSYIYTYMHSFIQTFNCD